MNHPHADEFKLYFEELYSRAGTGCIVNLSSNVYIPVLDDPVTPTEVLYVTNRMKKGGYDFPVQIVKILTESFLHLLVKQNVAPPILKGF